MTSHSNASSVQYVAVPVPAQLVPQVMAFITESLGATGDSGQWTERELRKLWVRSAQNMRATLALLAEAKGAPVTGDEIAKKALGKEAKGYSVAGMMGAFSRRMKGQHKGKSPIVAEYDADVGIWTYRIASTEVAATFLKLWAQPD